MKTIEKYVFSSFLTSFLLAFLVLTFVLTIGLLFQIVGYILDGLSASLIGRFILVSFPETLQWTAPLALLVSSVLVFSRMSADSEISAMRACGINLYQVMKWPLAFGLFCTLLGAWVNNEIVPRGHEIRRSMKSNLSVGNCIDALKPGVWYDEFSKVRIRVADKEDRTVRGLLVEDESAGFTRHVWARSATFTEEGRDVHIDLNNMKIWPIDKNNEVPLSVTRFQYVLDDVLSDSEYTKKLSDLRFFELLDDIARRKREIVQTEANLKALRTRGKSDAAAAAASSAGGKVPFDAWYASLEPGAWIDCFGRARLRFARKNDIWLEDVELVEIEDGKDVRTLRAERAHVTPKRGALIFDLVGSAEGTGENHETRFEIPDVISSSLHEMRRNLSKAKVAFSSRLVMAAASLCFVLIGIPLGIRAQRKDSTIGMAISLAVALGYYLCSMLMWNLEKNYALHPEILIWLPVLACFGLAAWFTRKNL